MSSGSGGCLGEINLQHTILELGIGVFPIRIPRQLHSSAYFAVRSFYTMRVPSIFHMSLLALTLDRDKTTLNNHIQIFLLHTGKIYTRIAEYKVTETIVWLFLLASVCVITYPHILRIYHPCLIHQR